MRLTTALFSAAIFGVSCLIAVQSAVAEDQPQTNTLDGCICEVNKSEGILKVVPWNREMKKWQFNAAQRFRYDDKTKISAENNLTVAEVMAGKVINTYHFLGFQQGKLAGKPFDIKDLSGLVGRRTTLHWAEKAGKRQAVLIELPYLFGGESMPAMVGSNSAQMVGSDNCPCGSK